jgi:hypothetical protein
MREPDTVGAPFTIELQAEFAWGPASREASEPADPPLLHAIEATAVHTKTTRASGFTTADPVRRYGVVAFPWLSLSLSAREVVRLQEDSGSQTATPRAHATPIAISPHGTNKNTWYAPHAKTMTTATKIGQRTITASW